MHRAMAARNSNTVPKCFAALIIGDDRKNLSRQNPANLIHIEIFHFSFSLFLGTAEPVSGSRIFETGYSCLFYLS